MTVGLYPTNPAPEVAYLLSHSGARVLIAEDQEQVDKALAVLDQLPDLEQIVYLEPRGIRYRYDDPRLLSWDDFLALGAEHRDVRPGRGGPRMAEATEDDVRRSSTPRAPPGRPRARCSQCPMWSSASRCWSTAAASPRRRQRLGPHAVLPAAVPRRGAGLHHLVQAGAGVQVNFAESIATVQPNLREVQPTILFGVPRIWEKLLASVRIRIDSATWLKRAFGRFWLRVADGIGATLVRTGGRHTAGTRLRYAIGWLFFYRALRERIGMRRVRYAASAAAPIAPEVLRFFMGIGVPMHEVYGMTENTAIATGNRPGRVKLGTVGEPHAGTELRIDETTGEILTRHPGTFAGYCDDPEATARAIDPDGWLHTGDVGEWVDGTYVKITDRVKDIIITAGGKNVAPSEIENALKASPYIKEAIVIGDRRPYLTALIGIELETVGDWAQRRKLPYTTYRDLGEKHEVLKLVQAIVDEVNARFATVEQVKKFPMLPKELDHEDGELTATQKVKRTAIATLFADLVEEHVRER